MVAINEYLELHTQFAFSYLLIGLLEVTLRREIPVTLSKDNQGEDVHWYSHLPLNERGQNSLNIALQISRKSPENYLPLSFWRFLLSNKNYGSLWLPSLHRVFPEISSPKRINIFRTIDKNMDTALRLRNNVAHFNLDALKNMHYSQERVKWLLINLGVESRLLNPSNSVPT
ncbi:MAG: hypothetical protein NTZ91_01460 [Actinobacteria bacterium]|nr:hypothetical protein [Actinomycetota bacterium]